VEEEVMGMDMGIILAHMDLDITTIIIMEEEEDQLGQALKLLLIQWR
jgi:hypothetical protein